VHLRAQDLKTAQMDEQRDIEQAPPRVHPSAILGPQVELGAGVEIGPFCVLEGRVKIGDGTRLLNHVTIFGDTELGEQNVLHPNVVIGDEPQDIAYRGDERRVRIGRRNIFREGATVHRGSQRGDVTILGDDNYVMQNAHVAHDCRIGNGVIIAGGALIAGWAEVADGALISGNCAVHQFVRVGRLALMRGMCSTSRDIPPFCIAAGTHTLRAVNVTGLKRAGFSAEAISALRHAFRLLFGSRRNLSLALEELCASENLSSEVRELVEFIRASKRGVAFGPKQHSVDHP
jgi:UDP-N-acetylglucosamine acyltransferase